MNKNIKTICEQKPIYFYNQHQDIIPGIEEKMIPKPIFDNPNYKASGRLKNKVAVVTGGDSGIGRATAILFAKEGCDLIISYYNEDIDALKTQQIILNLNRKCILIKGDINTDETLEKIKFAVINNFNKLDILVNNVGTLFPKTELLNNQDTRKTFDTNIISYFNLTEKLLPYINRYGSIINTSSSSVYTASPGIADYISSKSSVVGFTRSLALFLTDRNIRVNAVAPGPVWTPIITTSLNNVALETFGFNTPMKRIGNPVEVAPTYLFLASNSSSYITGQVFHVDGALTRNS